MPMLSERARAVEPSRTIAMNQRARELKAAGRDVIDLTVGEPDFRPPRRVLEAAAAAALAGADRYTPVAGLPELRELAAAACLADGALGYGPGGLMVAPGAKGALSAAFMALAGPGDEVLIPTPAWLSYAEQAKLVGAEPRLVYCPPESGYKLDPAALRGALTGRTRLIVLGSPANPTGAVYSRTELEALAAVLEARPDIWILSDEVYRSIRYVAEAPSPAELPALRARTAVVRGLSKSHAMTGWRIGFLAGPQDFIDAAIAIQGQTLTCAARVSQLAAIEALKLPPAELKPMLEAYEDRRALVCAGLAAARGLGVTPPEGAFYAFPRIEGLVGATAPRGTIRSSDELALYLLEEGGVALVPGSAFGDDGALRLSFAASEACLAEALDRIAASLAKLG
ncbi:MAG: pyridoxal phosphate-dependent aminotransferase [Spirochaetaceae bacterium]|nr:pyridoxal phosphate-dependent aminotransferase [Spirochaetaceae bacterium]